MANPEKYQIRIIATGMVSITLINGSYVVGSGAGRDAKIEGISDKVRTNIKEIALTDGGVDVGDGKLNSSTVTVIGKVWNRNSAKLAWQEMLNLREAFHNIKNYSNVTLDFYWIPEAASGRDWNIDKVASFDAESSHGMRLWEYQVVFLVLNPRTTAS